MKINNIPQAMPSANIYKKNIANQSFTGLSIQHANKAIKDCAFVFDIDGTIGHGKPRQVRKIMEFAQRCNATLIYATGNNVNEFLAKQSKWAKKGLVLPTPQYLVSNNGQFIFENIAGALIKNTDYEKALKEQTHFDDKLVYGAMSNIAHTKKYEFNNKTLKKIDELTYKDVLFKEPEDPDMNIQEIIAGEDPGFHTSKITHYEWNPSEFMSEYFVAAGVNIKQLQKEIQEYLGTWGIKTKFIFEQYNKKIMDACNEDILLKSHPLRRHEDGSMTAMFLCPADKADGVRFVKEKLNIPYKELLIAGNGGNDISLAELTKEGANFICVKNSEESLKAVCQKLKKKFSNVFMAKCGGARGIWAGINKIVKLNPTEIINN